MGTDRTALTYVKYLWRDDEANRLSGVDRLVYRSNRLGDATVTRRSSASESALRTLRARTGAATASLQPSPERS